MHAHNCYAFTNVKFLRFSLDEPQRCRAYVVASSRFDPSLLVWQYIRVVLVLVPAPCKERQSDSTWRRLNKRRGEVLVVTPGSSSLLRLLECLL